MGSVTQPDNTHRQVRFQPFSFIPTICAIQAPLPPRRCAPLQSRPKGGHDRREAEGPATQTTVAAKAPSAPPPPRRTRSPCSQSAAAPAPAWTCLQTQCWQQTSAGRRPKRKQRRHARATKSRRRLPCGSTAPHLKRRHGMLDGSGKVLGTTVRVCQNEGREQVA